MRTLILCNLLAYCCFASSACGQFRSFQQGVNGYTGTADTEFRSANSTTDFSNENEISVDQNDGSIPGLVNRTQAAIRFDNIFGAGPGQVPLDEEIFFAELVFFVTSPTAEDAIISLDRVLGADQNRTTGSGAWQETDTWSSLGGSTTTNQAGVLEFNPIEVGTSGTLAPGNEALAAPEDSLANPNDGQLTSPGTIENLDFVSIVVTQSVQAWQDGAPNHGWSINNTTGNGWDFTSSEFAISNIADPADAAEAQALLDFLGLTEEQVRPQLRVGVGVSGDFDFDGDIDGFDFDILRANLGNQVNRAELGDVDFDADVDLEDFAAFKTAFNALNGVGSFEAMLASVPEPSTLGLTVLALTAFASTRRNQR